MYDSQPLLFADDLLFHDFPSPVPCDAWPVTIATQILLPPGVALLTNTGRANRSYHGLALAGQHPGLMQFGN